MDSSAPSGPTRASGAHLVLAWSVHLFTASGAVLGTIALLDTMAGNYDRAVLIMLATMAIDAIDGTFARAVGVARILPKINGRRLDDMVDFLNFVILPVAFLVVIGGLHSIWWAAPPVLASCYGFAREDAKTEDDFFLGWPSYWNILAIYVYLLGMGPTGGTLWVALLSFAVFVPFKYVYPSRAPMLRVSTNLAGVVWGLTLTAATLWPEFARSIHLTEITLSYVVYYLAISCWMGDWLGLRRKGRGQAG